MTAVTLLEELRQLGASVAVVDGSRLRIEVPRGRVTPQLRESLTRHKGELLALLSSTLPPQEPHRLTLGDCLELLIEMHASNRAAYEPGALSLLDTDADLCRRFHATEARIDELAGVPSGPTEADFRTAIEAHAAVWRELVARYRAHLERRAERPHPMPERPDDTVLAIRVSYGDGEPGTWDVIREGRRR